MLMRFTPASARFATVAPCKPVITTLTGFFSAPVTARTSSSVFSPGAYNTSAPAAS